MGTRANLLAGGGTLYIAPSGTALPELNDLDTGIVAPTSPWVATGFRVGPLDIEYTPEIEKIFVEEHLGAIKANLTAENAMLSTELGERDKTAYTQAISAVTASDVAAGANQTGQSKWAVGDGSLTEVSLLFVGRSPAGFSRAYYAPVAVADVKVKDTYAKKFNGMPVSWLVLADPAQTAGKRLLQAYDITAVPTS